jgi:hypothetical protein
MTPVVAAHPLSLNSPYAALSLSQAVFTSVDSGTLAGYRSSSDKYERWCRVRRLSPWPTDEVLLAAWCVHLGSTVSVASIQGYASAIKFVHPLMCSTPWPCDNSVIVHQALRHLKKKYGMAGKGTKFAICMGTLRRILPLLPGWPEAELMLHDDIMFASASLIATCTFLRGGEFTTSTKSTRDVLLGGDVRISSFNGRRTVTTNIPRPKNAWWIAKVEARCFDSGEAGIFSPVRWLENYRAHAACPLADDAAAFQTCDGEALSRDWMVSRTQSLLQLAGIFMLAEDGSSFEFPCQSKLLASWWCSFGYTRRPRWPNDHGSWALAFYCMGGVRCVLHG